MKPVDVPFGCVVSRVRFEGDRPIIVTDSDEMAERIRALNPDVDVQVCCMTIPAAKQREWYRLTDTYDGAISNRHERRRKAAIARRRTGT